MVSLETPVCEFGKPAIDFEVPDELMNLIPQDLDTGDVPRSEGVAGGVYL